MELGRLHFDQSFCDPQEYYELGFVPASKMRLRRGLGYPTQITVPYVFTACNLTLQKKIYTRTKITKMTI